MAKNTFSSDNKGMKFQCVKMLVASLLPLFLFSSCLTEKRVSVVETQQVETQQIERQIQRIVQLERENAELSGKLTEQKMLSKKLQTTLLIRYKEIDTCQQTNEKLKKELLQSKAKLVTRGSKLEAATLIAEATAIISTLEKRILNEPQKIVCKKAIQNLEDSKLEMADGNYKSAVYLSRIAIEQAKGIDDIGKDPSTARLVKHEIFFSTPLHMELLTTGNLRDAPSIKADVKKVLPEGSKVTAISFKQNWVKVKLTDSERSGWIHLSLLIES